MADVGDHREAYAIEEVELVVVGVEVVLVEDGVPKVHGVDEVELPRGHAPDPSSFVNEFAFRVFSKSLQEENVRLDVIVLQMAEKLLVEVLERDLV